MMVPRAFGKNSLENSPQTEPTKLAKDNASNASENEENVSVLKSKLSTLEGRCNDLHFRNEKLKNDLEHEKHKVAQMERQLRFASDNQSIMKKLREAFINSQCSDNFERKLVEIRDKSVQTWSGVLCRACLDTEKLRVELEKVRASYAGCIIIKENELDKLNATLQNLKSYIKIEIDNKNVREIGQDAGIIPMKFAEIKAPAVTKDVLKRSSRNSSRTEPRTHSLDREYGEDKTVKKTVKPKSKPPKTSTEMQDKK